MDLIFSKHASLHYVFLEAGSGNESLSFLRKYAPLSTKKLVAEKYLRSAKLQGTEYLDITSNHDFILYGVEDMALYAQSVSLYRKVAGQREKFQDYLRKVEVTIKDLKPKLYNPLLLAFDEKYQRFGK